MHGCKLEFISCSGSELYNLKASITCSSSDQIFVQPIYWTRATNFSESATHAIGFGPGAMSGIGPLTARNLDGWGVRAIVI